MIESAMARSKSSFLVLPSKNFWTRRCTSRKSTTSGSSGPAMINACRSCAAQSRSTISLEAKPSSSIHATRARIEPADTVPPKASALSVPSLQV